METRSADKFPRLCRFRTSRSNTLQERQRMKTSQLDVLQSAQDVAERLATEFDGIVPPGLVASIVLEAVGDLNGQVQPEAFPELLHRLAHYRLEIRVERYSGRSPIF